MRRAAAVGALICFAVGSAFLAAAAANPYSNLALRYQQGLGGLGVVAGLVLLVIAAVRASKDRSSLDARGRAETALPIVVAGLVMALTALVGVTLLVVLVVAAALLVTTSSEPPSPTVAPPLVPSDLPSAEALPLRPGDTPHRGTSSEPVQPPLVPPRVAPQQVSEPPGR